MGIPTLIQLRALKAACQRLKRRWLVYVFLYFCYSPRERGEALPKCCCDQSCLGNKAIDKDKRSMWAIYDVVNVQFSIDDAVDSAPSI